MKMGIFRSMHSNASVAQIGDSHSKREIGEYLISNGFDPAEFLFCYLYENESEIQTGPALPDANSTFRRCYYEDLPDDLECFFCRAKDKSVIYDYHRHRDPRISKRELGGN